MLAEFRGLVGNEYLALGIQKNQGPAECINQALSYVLSKKTIKNQSDACMPAVGSKRTLEIF